MKGSTALAAVPQSRFGECRPRDAPRRDPRAIERSAHQKVSQHLHFRGRAGNYEFVHHNGVLTVRGRVPSFYLKQLLQHALRDLEGVRSIDNQVDVVACDGLSSVRDV